MTSPIERRTVGAFLDDLAGRTSDPAAGAAAAVTAATAAALVAMAARFSDGPDRDLAARADELRAELIRLADEDGRAYRQVLEARQLPRSSAHRAEQLAAALQAATEVPLRIGEAAAELTEQASRLALEGNPNLAGDAATAAVLAAAVTRAVCRMVEANVRLGRLGHGLLRRADGLVDRADKALIAGGEL